VTQEAHATPTPSSITRRLLPDGVVTLVFVAVAGLAALVAASWLVLVVAHLDDGYGMDHASGTWIALARYANDGTLYPPLYDGESFGGTRFMPVPILLQAGAAHLSAEYLISAKALSAILALAVAVATFSILRRRCPLPIALLLSSTLLVSGTGLVAATSIRNDALPLLLQLGALALVAASTSRRTIVAAGFLCSVALFCKVSAIWGPATVAVYLARRSSRGALTFAAAFVGLALCELAVFQLVSSGRFADNVLQLTATASDRRGSLDDILDRIRLIFREGLGPLVVLPLFATLGVALAVRRRDLSIYHLAFVMSVVVTSVVLVDPGAYLNHLLDVQVLSLIVIGELWRQLTPGPRTLSWAAASLVVVVVAATVATYAENVSLMRDTRVLVDGTAARDRIPRLAGVVSDDERVLSEDPFVPASRGQRPVVLDSFMLITLLERHPEWRRDIVERIESAEFDKIVLYYVPDEAPQWYRRVHLGPDVVGAIEARYRPARHVDGYWIYVPR
jgi:hypothetical protein